MAGPIPKAMHIAPNTQGQRNAQASGKSGEQAFFGKAKIACRHHGAVAPSFHLREAYRLEGGGGKAKCAGDRWQPVMHYRDNEQKDGVGIEISAGQRQQAGDQKRLLEVKTRRLAGLTR